MDRVIPLHMNSTLIILKNKLSVFSVFMSWKKKKKHGSTTDANEDKNRERHQTNMTKVQKFSAAMIFNPFNEWGNKASQARGCSCVSEASLLG